MNKRFFTCLILLLVQLNTFAQQLSPNSRISLITLGPAEELWSFAGHSVLRVQDPANGIDVNFNYGMFDFRTESFYLKFLRGTLPYQIGAFDFRDEYPYWEQDQRSVSEQVLNLSLAQKQSIYDKLLLNYQPENREYLYKFFYDNCSTRIRDVVAEACGDSLHFKKNLNADNSFRYWIRKYSDISKNDWAKFGMDLLIGAPSDEITGYDRAMFIPANMEMAFDSAQILSGDTLKSFVAYKTPLFTPEKQPEGLPISPIMLFSLLFLLFLGISWYEFKNKKWLVYIDKALFTITGLMGWFMVLLWFFTDHGVTQNNFNLLWCFPILFPAVFWLKKNYSKGIQQVFGIQLLLATLLLLIWGFIPQQIPAAVILIVGTVILRSFLIWKKKNWRV